MSGALPAAVDRALADLAAAADRDALTAAYTTLQNAALGKPGCLRTDPPLQVDWADVAWPPLVAQLEHRNNHVRSIAGQMLANLAGSAQPRRALADLPRIVAVTRDEKFVTARHVLQALWKFGLGTPALRRVLLDALDERFRNCADEKNATLIRYDIIVGLRALHDATGAAGARALADTLMDLETDPKYRKKYAGVWRGA